MSELTPERLAELRQRTEPYLRGYPGRLLDPAETMSLLNEIDRLRSAAQQEAEDWAATHTAIQELCLSSGIARIEVLGDGHGVPGIGDLADMLAKRVADLTAGLNNLMVSGMASDDAFDAAYDAAARLLAEDRP